MNETVTQRTVDEQFFEALSRHSEKNNAYDFSGVWILVTTFLRPLVASSIEVQNLSTVIKVIETIPSKETIVCVLKAINLKIEEECKRNNISWIGPVTLDGDQKRIIRDYIESARSIVNGFRDSFLNEA